MADLRFALRSLWRHPGHSVIAIATLGLAIAGATAIFSVLNAVVLRPLPYPEPERLVLIRDQWLPRFPEFSVSPGRALAWRERTHSFEGVAAAQGANINLTGAGDPVRLRVAVVNANFFQVIGGAPLAGRVFRPDETDENVVILGEGLWRSRFGASDKIVGQSIQLDGRPVQVVGVMPALFTLPSSAYEAWMIWNFSPRERQSYGSHYATVLARLKPGVTIDAARADLSQVAKKLEDEKADGDANRGWTVVAFPLHEYAIRSVRTGILVLVAAVGGLLLIACANVANLLLARGLGRSREFALRAALGAARGRLVRQMFLENIAIGVSGSVLGVALGWWLLKAMLAAAPATLPRAATIHLDAATLGVALLLAIATPLLFGILPAWQMSRANLNSLVQAGGRSGAQVLPTRTRAALIVVEVALSVALVAASMLLIRSFDRLLGVKPGFDVNNAIAMSVTLPQQKYDKPELKEQFFANLVDRVQAQPGVDAAAIVQSFPLLADHVAGLEIDKPVEQGVTSPSTNFYASSPGYFKAMGIPLLKGRDFTAADAWGKARVSIISKAVADKYFAGVDPIGHKTRVTQGPNFHFSEIVGVVGDVKQYGLDRETTLAVYEPARQHAYFSNMTMVVRTKLGADAAGQAVRSVLKDLDPNLPVANVRTLQAVVDSTTGSKKFLTVLLGVFSAVALVLAAIGVYGLVAFTVGQRAKEIGIRLALGARAKSIVTSVLGQGLGLTLAGIAVGGVLSFWAMQYLKSELFEVTEHDPVAFAVAPTILIIAAALACVLPVMRALRVDPAVALRE
jgi:putative ABC transport system permease protein